MKKADSQIGFLKFVIRPTYLLLGEILPRVKGEVMPIIDKQIEYWMNEKSAKRMSSCEFEASVQRENLHASAKPEEDSIIK